MSRLCLACDRAFTARGRINRLCDSCSEINNGVHDLPEVYVPSLTPGRGVIGKPG